MVKQPFELASLHCMYYRSAPVPGSIVVVNSGTQNQQVIRLVTSSHPQQPQQPAVATGGGVTVTPQPQPILIPVGQQQQQQQRGAPGQPDKIFLANHPTAGQILVRKWSPSPSPSPPGVAPAPGSSATTTTVSRLIPVSGPPPPGARIATLRPSTARPQVPVALRPATQRVQQGAPARIVLPAATAPTTLNQNTPLPTTLALPQEPVSAAELMQQPSSSSTIAPITLPSHPVSTDELFQKPLPVSSPSGVHRMLAGASPSPVKVVALPTQPRSPQQLVVQVNTPLPKEIQLPSEPVPKEAISTVEANRNQPQQGKSKKKTCKSTTIERYFLI